MKYSVVTFGCRVNQADSLGFEEELIAKGAIATDVEHADLVVVNTCSVTASADQAARQTIRRVNRVNPTARIVVTGCYATRKPDDVAGLPQVVRVVSNPGKPQLIPLVLEGLGHAAAGPRQTTAERFGDGDGACGATVMPGIAGRTAFTLRVQTGCSQPCSYCIIPTTRGEPQSVHPDQVVAEAERVASAGFKEIALTGVHLGSYGRDLDQPSSLFALLNRLHDWTSRSARSEVLFRISSLEPMDCSPDVVGVVETSGAFAPHFHLPLQHASGRMLRAMRRPYSIEYYDTLVRDVRFRIPHASIGTDIIVGFPGESDDDFEQLVGYLANSTVTHVHVFPYSDRPGTAASAMSDRPEPLVVRERARRVREIGRTLQQRFQASQLGTSHRALTIDSGATAVTGNYLKVSIPAGRQRNEWLQVRIRSIDPLAAEVISSLP